MSRPLTRYKHAAPEDCQYPIGMDVLKRTIFDTFDLCRSTLFAVVIDGLRKLRWNIELLLDEDHKEVLLFLSSFNLQQIIYVRLDILYSTHVQFSYTYLT